MFNDEKLRLIYLGRESKDNDLSFDLFGSFSFLTEDKKHILITPKDIDAFSLRPEDIIVINRKGEDVENIKNHSITDDLNLHLTAYDVREENIDVVMHINPKEASQRADEGHRVVFLSDCINPKDNENGDISMLIQDPIAHRDYMLIKGHGVLVVGKGIFETLEKAKYIEEISKIKMPKEEYTFDSTIDSNNDFNFDFDK